MLPTHHQGRRSAGGSTSASVQRVQNVPSPTSAGSRAVVGITLPRPAPRSLRELSELQRAHTPLRHSAFEHELKALRTRPGSPGYSMALTTVFPPATMVRIFLTQHATSPLHYSTLKLWTMNCRKSGIRTRPGPLLPASPQEPPHIRAWGSPKEKRKMESDPSPVSTGRTQHQ